MPGPGDLRDGAPKETPTSVDAANPFDPTEHRTVAESDPPTALVRRDSFRELPPGSVVDDTYEIASRLGAGAMGEVYAARHMKLGKRVAIKVIGRHLSGDDASIERFAREARALAQVQHPAIVAVEHVGELADGRAFFVMEYLRGETLFDRLARGRVPLAEALRVIDQTARGLEAAHASGVTHRDLKPENVFLVHLPGEPLIVKLVDFGLAKLAAAVAAVDFRAEPTQSGATIGTPMYMSPEQAHGPDVDHRTDIYALGCIAYELVLGQPPFPHARTAPEFWAAHLHTTPPHPRSIWPEVPPQLDLVLFAMLAKDPALRPTLAQVRAVVATVAAMLPERAGDRASTMRVRESRNRFGRNWTAAVAAVLLAGGIAVGTRLTSGPTETTRRPEKPTSEVEQVDPPPADAPRVPVDASATSPSPPDAVTAPPHRKMPARSTSRSQTKTPRDHPPAKSGSDSGGPAARTVAPPDPPQTPPTPIDRNQTINPFEH
jgi:serine/threonine-protein kinase